MTQKPPQDIVIRDAGVDDLEHASALCLRSKAHWGYDQDFIEACREELTLRPKHLDEGKVAIAMNDGVMVGVAQVEIEGHNAELEKLFVDPPLIGFGIGRKLFDWARGIAVEAGATSIYVTADPQAVPFYAKVGFVRTGEEPSGSIPGRALPTYELVL